MVVVMLFHDLSQGILMIAGAFRGLKGELPSGDCRALEGNESGHHRDRRQLGGRRMLRLNRARRV